MTFKEAIEATPDVKACYHAGLQALGGDSKKIRLQDTTKCEGSVDIDGCTRTIYPQSNRWDYCLSYKNEVFFVEVHTANTTEVSGTQKTSMVKRLAEPRCPGTCQIKIAKPESLLLDSIF